MKSLDLSRYALCSCVAAALLAGCGGSQPPIGAPGVAARLATAPNRAIARNIETASSYRVLYSFGDGSDGQRPHARLIDVNGTLYGTTAYGGKYNKGTVFSTTTTGAEHVLHSFSGRHDGESPSAGLIDVGGTLYGTTSEGGTYNSGTFFSISTTGTEHVLYSFVNTDGAFPEANLIEVGGTLYGTTNAGGVYTVGTVFSINTGGVEHVLYNFGRNVGGRIDAAFPAAGLIDVKGTLYGTTSEGGKYRGQGTVFSTSTTGTEHVLHSFGKGSDGSYPAASLVDVKGALYGTTTNGGAGSVVKGGTVFSISTGGVEHVLHSFGNGADGSYPAASLVDVKGTLYGTTAYGGAYGDGSLQGGTVFSITTGGAEHVLHSFGSVPDGGLPEASLIEFKDTLYGTTWQGGKHGEGTVFALKP
jgi:uncharacterized repeat protein (TIGR03803 family)